MRNEVSRNRSAMNPVLCPGIESLIRALHEEGKLLGIASGNLASVAWAKLEAAGLRDYFSFGSFSGERELRTDIFRHAIEQARARLQSQNGSSGSTHDVCFIGDTPADVLAAHANNVPIVAVATGIYSVDQLRAHNPALCLSCCAELFPGHGVTATER
jgi:phosphoglycolate phosphatase-like HAD superfamily hydrolase